MNVRVIILIYDSVTEWSWQHDWLTSTNWYKRFESLITDHNLIMEKSLKWQTQALTRAYNAWTIPGQNHPVLGNQNDVRFPLDVENGMRDVKRRKWRQLFSLLHLTTSHFMSRLTPVVAISLVKSNHVNVVPVKGISAHCAYIT